jgi:hypothetical protein
MSYFIFGKNLDGIDGTLSRIAENENDLNNLNIQKEVYKIIEVSQNDFDQVKLGLKYPQKYNNDTITYYAEYGIKFNDKNTLENYIKAYKAQIKNFLDNNSNNASFVLWNNYYNQLNNLNLDTVVYPLNKSLEQYFQDLGQTSLHTLQLP